MHEDSQTIQFEEKYQSYGKMLFRIGMLHLHNKQDVEDMMQETFLKLLYKAPEFVSAEHEKAWLIRVTVNSCKNTLKNFWRVRRADSEIESFSHNPEDNYILKQLFNLPDKYKAVIYLHYYEGYSVNEIADILKITVSAVKMRLSRARQNLHELISE